MAKAKYSEDQTLDFRVKRSGRKAAIIRRYLDRLKKESGARSYSEVAWDILQNSLKNSIN